MTWNIEKINLTFEKIQQKIQAALTEKEIKEIKKSSFGKTGIISQIFHSLINLNGSEKKTKIQLVSDWRNKLLDLINQKEKEIIEKELEKQLLKEKIDVTLPGKKLPLGGLHPLSQLIQKIYAIFLRLDYQVIESPEIETEENNFTKLNMPPGHPARAMQDTFYLNQPNFLLRTHTTNTQSRALQTKPNQELKIISAGKVYRRDEDDATHTHQFTQVDCFVVGKDISFSYLKGTLELLVKELLETQQTVRLRPSYFPFTEPSVEVDASCVQCQTKGCEICKKSGWVEIAGAGLIHPQVLENCGFNSQVYSGFAFAFGLERLLMIKYGIEDIRNFYLNDIRFLKQFVGSII
jgi:phenylalanyl-tRNA synthetase alpha chain